MRIILGASSFGFGPVSKLGAIANLLNGFERLFVGDGTAYQFARRNPNCYEKILSIDEFTAHPAIWKRCDFSVIVMEPDLAFQLIQLGIPTYYFDSLLDLWILPDGIAPLASATAKIRQSSVERGKHIFHSFSLHERKVLAHMLSRRAFAQNFPGVPQRVAELHRLGFGTVELLGSMIDPTASTVGAQRKTEAEDGWSMVITLGGVCNPFIGFFENDYIIDLMERWAAAFLASRDDCREVVLCCGRYGAPTSRRIGRGRLVRQFAAHDEFIALLKNAEVLISAPGRTTLHEAYQLRKVPVLLPEQHYGQHVSLKKLEGTGLGTFSLPLNTIVDLPTLPLSPPKATDIIVSRIRHILDSNDLFLRFDRMLRTRVQNVRGLDSVTRYQILDEIKPFVTGQNFAESVHSIVAQCVKAQRNSTHSRS
jgi:hypothetical protein